jgi:hypothetical protein
MAMAAAVVPIASIVTHVMNVKMATKTIDKAVLTL